MITLQKMEGNPTPTDLAIYYPVCCWPNVMINLLTLWQTLV